MFWHKIAGDMRYSHISECKMCVMWEMGMLRVWTLKMPGVMSHCAELHLLCNATPRPRHLITVLYCTVLHPALARHLITDNIVFYLLHSLWICRALAILPKIWTWQMQKGNLKQDLNSSLKLKILIFVKNRHHQFIIHVHNSNIGLMIAAWQNKLGSK